MLVAAVAELTLKKPTSFDPNPFPWTDVEGERIVSLLNQLLDAWAIDYPDYSDIISAAVWADHIKCRQRSSFCSARHFDGIEIFNPTHFVDIPINDTSPVDASHIRPYQFRPDNAYWLLEQVGKSLSNIMMYSNATDPLTIYNFTVEQMHDLLENYKVATNSRANRHERPPKDVHSLLNGHGTRFSYNLLLRLFIHILGDVHQPLHTVSRKSVCTPQGDRGGNGIAVKVPQSESTESQTITLHELWDSAGGSFAGNYPDFSTDQARRQATELVARYPPSSTLNASLLEVFITSVRLAQENVYRELRDRRMPCGQVYIPSNSYIDLLIEQSHRQVTNAGYRLAAFLSIFAQSIPQHAANLPPTTRDVKRWKFAALASMLALAASVPALIYLGLVLQRERQHTIKTVALGSPLLDKK